MEFLEGDRPIALAHRGGAYGGLENSMEAFSRCVDDLGYEYIETDVHLSRDGQVVAFHDRILDRATDQVGRIRDLTWSQISRAKIGGAATIPLLIDILRSWPTVKVNIDAKSSEVVLPLAQLLREEKALDRVCLAAFSDSRLARLRRMLGPRVCTSMGPREIGLLRMASYSRHRAGMLPLRGDCAQVPLRLGRRNLVDTRFVEACHALGKKVHVWTVDEPLEMKRLLSLGVDGIITDRPDVLRELLISRGQWTHRNPRDQRESSEDLLD